jgi:hypothetical protein
MGAWANYAEATASIIGGALAAISLRTPFYAEIGISTIALALALLLREPERTVYEGENHWEQIRDIVKYSLHGHAELKWLILYTSFIGAGTMTSWWFMQAYFDTVGLPIIWFGVTWAVINASVGVFSTNAHRFESLLGRKQSLINLVIILVVAYILVAQYTTVYGIGLLTLFALVRGFNTPIIRDYTNALVTSDIRATVMSVESMTSRLAFILTGPILGWVHDTWSLTTAFTTAAICYGCLGTVSLAFLHWNDAL